MPLPPKEPGPDSGPTGRGGGLWVLCRCPAYCCAEFATR
jgi:hypothetical protein